MSQLTAITTKVLNTLQESKGMYLDGHDGKIKNAYAVAVFNKTTTDQFVVILHPDCYFCLNPIELNDGAALPALSRWSVGGVIEYRTGENIVSRLEKHNVQNKNSPFAWHHEAEILIDSVVYF